MSTIKKIKISNSTYDLGVNQSAIGWGGDSVASNVTPIGAAMSAMHSANRLAFLDPDAINVEYSNNAGSTWTSYGAANADKIKLVTFEDAVSFNLGKSGEASTNNKLRITLTASTTSKMYFYTLAVKLLINVSTSGHGMNVLIERKNGASGASWDSIGTYDLAGWSGWNDIPLYTVIGGSSNQTSQPWQLRFTFNCTSVNSSYKNSLSNVLSLKLFGVTNWMGASTLASTGNLYYYDWQQNATFPKNVTAESFSGNGAQLTALNATNITQGTLPAARLPNATSSTLGGVKVGSNITVNSGTISLTKANVTSALGYTPPTSNTTYSIATTSTPGLVKPVSVITKPTLNSVTTTSGRYYSVQMSSDGSMFVNVPWQAVPNDYYHSTGSWNGLTYTATAHEGAPELKFTLPTGTTGTTVALGNHTHSQYLTAHQDISGKANLSGATFTGAVTITSGVNLKFNKIQVPVSSGNSTYSNGNKGQVLKSNGTTVYWAEDNNTDADSKTSSSNTTSKIYLVGPTSQSSAGQTTYSNSSCYASGGYLYSNGKKVDMDNISGGVEWSTF